MCGSQIQETLKIFIKGNGQRVILLSGLLEVIIISELSTVSDNSFCYQAITAVKR